MTVNDYKNQFIGKLSSIYDETESLNIFYMVMEFVLNYKKVDCVLNARSEISFDKQKSLDDILKRLLTNEPIQYITEQAFFYGYPFKVSHATLIPRPETEELVEWVLQTMNKQLNKTWRVLDIGTGTGCIPITVKKEFPNAIVSAIDISAEALKIAKENAINLQVDVNFIQQDILKTVVLDTYDIIISNPPYVRNLEKVEIKNNVLKFEPHLALFVEDNDPLVFYRKITQLACENLSKDGFLFFEINQYLGKEMTEMVEGFFDNIELKKDMLGNDRMMKISKSKSI